MKNTMAIEIIAGSLLTAGSVFAAGAQTKTTTKTTTTTATRITTPAKSDIPADLAKEAKISLETARATALARVPHGVIRSEELERENGNLIYSFDVAVPHRSGIQEVNVNAVTGKVLGVHHETAKAEKKEAAQENKPPAGR
jgi:uncharacterized membrane protein YkoI